MVLTLCNLVLAGRSVLTQITVTQVFSWNTNVLLLIIAFKWIYYSHKIGVSNAGCWANLTTDVITPTRLNMQSFCVDCWRTFLGANQTSESHPYMNCVTAHWLKVNGSYSHGQMGFPLVIHLTALRDLWCGFYLLSSGQEDWAFTSHLSLSFEPNILFHNV